MVIGRFTRGSPVAPFLQQIASFAAVLVLCSRIESQPAPSIVSGVVIEHTEVDSGVDDSGLRIGDVILSWSRGAAIGKIESPFDWMDLEIEQIPRGAVISRGLRDSREQSWTLSNSLLQITIRPILRPGLVAGWQHCRDLENPGKWSDAAACWRGMMAQVKATDPAWLNSWLEYKVAESLVLARRFNEADNSFRRAIEGGRPAGAIVPALLLLKWGEALADRSKWTQAEDCYQACLQQARSMPAATLLQAVTLNRLGVVAYKRGDPDRAEQDFQQELNIQQKLAPRSLDTAKSLHNLANLADDRGDLDRAEQYHQQALALRQLLAPGSLHVSASLQDLGVIADERGNIAQAEEYYTQALAIAQKIQPGGFIVAEHLSNLGVLMKERGDLDRAEGLYEQALAIFQRSAPDSDLIADTLDNLGNLASIRGDLALAEKYDRQALAIAQNLDPDSHVVPGAFANMGDILKARGDLDGAEA